LLCDISLLLEYVPSTMGVSKESISKFLTGNRFYRKITHPQFRKLQAKLTGETLKGWSNRREKNKLKTTIKIS